MVARKSSNISKLWWRISWPFVNLRKQRTDPLLSEIIRTDSNQAYRLSGVGFPMWACPSPMDRMHEIAAQNYLALVNTTEGFIPTELSQEVHNDILLFGKAYIPRNQDQLKYTPSSKLGASQEWLDALKRFQEQDSARTAWFDYAVPFRMNQDLVYEIRQSAMGHPLYFPHRNEEFLKWAAEELVLGKAKIEQLRAQVELLFITLLCLSCIALMLWYRWR